MPQSDDSRSRIFVKQLHTDPVSLSPAARWSAIIWRTHQS